MSSISLPKRAAIFAAAMGTTAAVGAAPALAGQPAQSIFGSGSSLQKIAQVQVWTPTWANTPADHPQISTSGVTATYTSSSSGGGLNEFGNNTGSFDPTQDSTANSAGQLDAYVGTDDPPSTTQLSNASAAATGGASTTISELTVPVAQAPVAILLSLPSGITVGDNTQIKLSNFGLKAVWDNNVQAFGGYAANTWGALLTKSGLTAVPSSPGANQFTDAGGSTGGGSAITRLVRSTASGTSYTFKGFLHLSNDANYTSTYVVDDDTWPVPTTNTYNGTPDSGGGAEVSNTAADAGAIGYANLADAAGTKASPGTFTSVATASTAGGSASHDILYALIQNNYGAGGTPTFSDPERGDGSGVANVYTGGNININGANSSEVGHWTVPTSGGSFSPTGSWGGTLADDPNISSHIAGGSSDYPIVAATYDLGFTHYSVAGSNLVSEFGGTATEAQYAGRAADSLLTYIAGQGQTDIVNDDDYYAKLPAPIDTDAKTAAALVKP